MRVIEFDLLVVVSCSLVGFLEGEAEDILTPKPESLRNLSPADPQKKVPSPKENHKLV